MGRRRGGLCRERDQSHAQQLRRALEEEPTGEPYESGDDSPIVNSDRDVFNSVHSIRGLAGDSQRRIRADAVLQEERLLGR